MKEELPPHVALLRASIRKKIDEVDDGLLKLLMERAKLVGAMQFSKRVRYDWLRDSEREREVVARLIAKRDPSSKYGNNVITNVWHVLFKAVELMD